MKFATFKSNGKSHYGAIHDGGIAALDPLFPEWPTLFDAVKNNGLSTLEEAAEKADIGHESFVNDMVLPNVRRIFCVGVNFPGTKCGIQRSQCRTKIYVSFRTVPKQFHRTQPASDPPAGKQNSRLRRGGRHCHRQRRRTDFKSTSL